MAKLIVGGKTLTIDTNDYKRLLNAARGNPNFRVMDDGNLIVNVRHIHMAQRDKGEGESTQEEAKQEKADTEPEILTQDKLRVLIDRSGLSIADFAASIGYSPGTVKVALHSGNISRAFSDAVIAKYGQD